MEDNLTLTLDWRTASYSGNGGGNCVEVAGGGRLVVVRDTKDRDGGTLKFSPGAWQAFTGALK
jgi:hypothetical protein